MVAVTISSVDIILKKADYDELDEEIEELVKKIRRNEAEAVDIHNLLDSYGVNFKRGIV